MAKTKVELNLPGLREVMKSGEMQAALQAAGSAVASNAKGDFGVRVHQYTYVAIANVYPETKDAAREVYENNALVKAAGAAGLRIG